MRSPQLSQIQWESRSWAWARDIGVLLSRPPAPSTGVRQFRSIGKDRALKPVGGLVISVLLHVAAFALITQFNFTEGYQPRREVQASDPAPIFIDMQALKELKILRALPVVRPPGPGGKPGAAEKPVKVVLQASTVQHPKFTVVLNPLKPDNNRQAINQKLSPPEMKIQVEQKLPDIVLVEGPAVPKPQVDMSLRQPIAPQNAQNHQVDPAPTVASNAPDLPFKITPTVQQPQLPVSYISSNMHAPHGPASSNGQPGGTSANASGDPSGGIVVVSVDPAAFSQLASLAQGNRYGALAIAPSKEGAGSPGGSPNGTGAGGSGGPGKGGDGSSGVGPGHSGGGGGGAEGAGKATFSAVGGTGRSGGVDKEKLLAPVLPATVYAVPASTKLRRAPLVVSTGPIGGGGIDAYGALSCGKVYTIFLPMPGKSWVLQYCAHQAGEAQAGQTNSGVVQVEAGLVPPSADQQFDFHRLTIPEKDADKMIILRGLIDKDGSLSDVHVYRGVLPEMDSSAAIAFSNWKFKPAMRAGLPIGVDVLVGIPARLPEKGSDVSTGAPGSQN
jgi:hypothetical protein